MESRRDATLCGTRLRREAGRTYQKIAELGRGRDAGPMMLMKLQQSLACPCKKHAITSSLGEIRTKRATSGFKPDTLRGGQLCKGFATR